MKRGSSPSSTVSLQNEDRTAAHFEDLFIAVLLQYMLRKINVEKTKEKGGNLKERKLIIGRISKAHLTTQLKFTERFPVKNISVNPGKCSDPYLLSPNSQIS
jgi:hypothetical protein